MVGYIYLITDTTNGMKYTGKHHYHIEGQLDPNYHGSGVIIKNIYKKRPETLKEEYIKTCYSEEEMCSDEQHYIEVFDTLWPHGYNLTKGGDGVLPCEETKRKLSKAHKGLQAGEKHPMFGKHHSEEAKKKMSLARKGKTPPNKGKHLSEEQKRKIGESLKGRTGPNKGKTMSEETKKKISEAKKKLYSSGKKHPMFGKHHSEESKKKMSLNHYDCSGENHYMFGKHHSEETKKKISDSKKGIPNDKCSKKVLQFTLDDEFVKEWLSIAECSRNGYAGANICKCCQGKRKSAYGFKWCYA